MRKSPSQRRSWILSSMERKEKKGWRAERPPTMHWRNLLIRGPRGSCSEQASLPRRALLRSYHRRVKTRQP